MEGGEVTHRKRCLQKQLSGQRKEGGTPCVLHGSHMKEPLSQAGVGSKSRYPAGVYDTGLAGGRPQSSF